MIDRAVLVEAWRRIVLPGGATVGEMLGDGRLDKAMASGVIPALLPTGKPE